jgi:hypothetical protein
MISNIFEKSSKKFEPLPVGVTNEAIKVSKNLSSTWLDMSYDQKHELQQFVFPKGATYNKENDRVRTPETHLLFELTKRTTGLYENKKSGTLSQNEMNSALVGPPGLEPGTDGL